MVSSLSINRVMEARMVGVLDPIACTEESLAYLLHVVKRSWEPWNLSGLSELRFDCDLLQVFHCVLYVLVVLIPRNIKVEVVSKSIFHHMVWFGFDSGHVNTILAKD